MTRRDGIDRTENDGVDVDDTIADDDAAADAADVTHDLPYSVRRIRGFPSFP